MTAAVPVTAALVTAGGVFVTALVTVIVTVVVTVIVVMAVVSILQNSVNEKNHCIRR